MKNTTVKTTTVPAEVAATSQRTQRVAWAAPPALAVVVLLHRNDPVDPMELAGSTTTWIWIHVALLGALVLLAHAVRTLLAGADGMAARVARGLLPLALVTYAAFDALVGLGTGVLVERAETLGPDAEQLVEHWWSVPTPISTIAGAAQLLWITVLGATAIARVTRDAPRFLVPVLAALTATFPFLHVRPIGLIPVALLATALWLNSGTSSSADGDRRGSSKLWSRRAGTTRPRRCCMRASIDSRAIDGAPASARAGSRTSTRVEHATWGVALSGSWGLGSERGEPT